VLQTEGYAVLEAQNGAMALKLMDMRPVSPQLAFLAKPFRNEDLLATIRNQLWASEHRPRQRSRTDPKGSEV
jgi:DNA-binding response OmpR family regulator